MNQIELQQYVENISLKYFNKPFKHQSIFNSRLRTTGGRYHLNTHHLDFNPKVLQEFGLEVFEGIVKHELCHYHLHLENKGYKHKDVDFKRLLKEVNGLRYTPSMETKTKSLKRWVYQCEKCQSQIMRKRRFNLDKYVCAHCHGRFRLEGEIAFK